MHKLRMQHTVFFAPDVTPDTDGDSKGSHTNAHLPLTSGGDDL